MHEYLTIDSGAYLRTSSLCILTAAWLNASQSSRDGVRLNKSTREYRPIVKHFEQSCGLDTALYKNLPFI